MRLLHLGLVVSLVLTTKASDDPNHNDSMGDNPTGQAAVHGHPKVAAGSNGYRHAPPLYPYKPPKNNSEPHYHDTYEDSNDVSDYYKDDYQRGVDVAAGSGRQKVTSETSLMSSEADSKEHTMPRVMTEDNAMMPSEKLTNAHESNEAMIEEMSEHDEIISIHELKEVLQELVKEAVDKIVEKKAGLLGKLKTAKQNFIAHDGEATGRNPLQFDPQQLQGIKCEEDIFGCVVCTVVNRKC